MDILKLLEKHTAIKKLFSGIPLTLPKGHRNVRTQVVRTIPRRTWNEEQQRVGAAKEAAKASTSRATATFPRFPQLAPAQTSVLTLLSRSAAPATSVAASGAVSKAASVTASAVLPASKTPPMTTQPMTTQPKQSVQTSKLPPRRVPKPAAAKNTPKK